MTQEELDKALTRVVNLSAQLTNVLADGVPAMYEEGRDDLAPELVKLNKAAAKLHERIYELREQERQRYRRELQDHRAEMARHGELREYEDYIAMREDD